MSSRTHTRQALLDKATELFTQQGYQGFSYQDLADHLNIRKASIHYHFPTKDDLGVALLAEYREQFTRWREHVLAQPVAEQFNTYLELFRQQLLRYQSICPCGMACAEYATLPEAMQAVLHSFLKDQQHTLLEVLIAAEKAGLIQAGLNLKAEVLMLGATMQGALQFARVYNDIAVFDRAMATAWKHLKL